MKQDISAKEAFLAEILKPGELWAGIILGKNGEPDYHLILINGQANDVNWKDAKEFAAKSGGELPTRREQSLLFANLKEQFEDRYYWSGEQHASLSDCAWGQVFGDGYGSYDFTYYECRARAVRRSPLI
jgi:hypothetical protein